MSDSVPESEIKIIRSAILNFLDEMKRDKRMVEQQIRERSESVRSNLLNTGASQFSYQDVDNLSRQYRDEFLDFYRDTVHLKIIAGASKKIRNAIQQGFIEAEIVQQEWLDGFTSLQDQINQYQEIANRADKLESELQGNLAVQGDVADLQEAIKEKEQIIAEKDQEIMNLTEGLTRMENQANAMGQSMLENSMTIEDLQEAISSRDQEISRLKNQIAEKAGNTEEIDVLKQHLREAQDRERALQQQVSTASSDLVNQLQDDLETTREQVLELRRDLVQKNEELHSLRLEQDEKALKVKQQEEQLRELKLEKSNLVNNREKIEQELFDLKQDKQRIDQELSKKEEELTNYSNKLDQQSKELTDIREQLEGYEGKVALSVEEQERINQELEEMKSTVEDYQNAVDYLKRILDNDVKFRTIIVLSSIHEPVRLDNIADAVNAPESLIERAIIELEYEGKVSTSREGRYLFCELEKDLNPPLLLSS